MKYGVPRLVNGLVRDLFREDAAAYYRDLLAYAVPELETLESAFKWIDRLAPKNSAATDNLDQGRASRTRIGVEGKIGQPSFRAQRREAYRHTLAQEAPCYRGETASRQKLMSR